MLFCVGKCWPRSPHWFAQTAFPQRTLSIAFWDFHKCNRWIHALWISIPPALSYDIPIPQSNVVFGWRENTLTTTNRKHGNVINGAACHRRGKRQHMHTNKNFKFCNNYLQQLVCTNYNILHTIRLGKPLEPNWHASTCNVWCCSKRTGTQSHKETLSTDKLFHETNQHRTHQDHHHDLIHLH